MYIFISLIFVLILFKIFKKKRGTPVVEISLDQSQQKALDLMENTSTNILLTGRAGTGKSEVLRCFRDRKVKQVVVLAYTGIAALNIKGQTIHSFFGFGINITPTTVPTREDQTMFKNIDAIVIDEISMVRADLLDCIDVFLRKNGPHNELPFGGVQMIFIGDLFQLPPIVVKEERHLFEGQPYTSPFFFNSKVFEAGLTVTHIELTEIHRQDKVKQEHFINFLNAIREGVHTEEHLSTINARHDRLFDESKETTAVHLVTTNEMAKNFNERKLQQLHSRQFTFYANVVGQWERKDYPTDDPLLLKVGAQIMLLNNDPEHRWVNGDIGKILKINEKDPSGLIEVKIIGSQRPRDYVGKWKWDRGHYTSNPETGEIEYQSDGSTFTQYPMKLAWAFTIHKAQGKTFDETVINFGNGTFAHGQAYVALSRGRTLEKTTLRRPVTNEDIKIDRRVIEFIKSIE